MTKYNRPLSPFMIGPYYRPQLTSMLSIMHRATGVFLSIGTLLLVYWLIALAGGPESYATAQACFGTWFGKVMLFAWSASLFYHLANGIRHLFWDAGYGFELPAAYASGYAVLIATAILTLAAWITGLSTGA